MTLPPIRGAKPPRLPESISQASLNLSKPENVELMTKVRAIEANMIDMKGALDRKITTLMEEIPA